MNFHRINQWDLLLLLALGVGLVIGVAGFFYPLFIIVKHKAYVQGAIIFAVAIPSMMLWMGKVVEPLGKRAGAERENPSGSPQNFTPFIAIAFLIGVIRVGHHGGYRDGTRNMKNTVEANCEQKVGYANANRCVREYTWSAAD